MNNQLQIEIQVWQEQADLYTAYIPYLDIASCGKSVEEARNNAMEALQAFIETTQEMGTLSEILEEAGFVYDREWKSPHIITSEKLSVAI